jgi:hypothetical protein
LDSWHIDTDPDTDPDPWIVHWITDPALDLNKATDPAHFGGGFLDANKNKFYFSKFFLLISYCRYVNMTLQNNLSLRSH